MTYPIISCRDRGCLPKDTEVKEKLAQYLRQEQYVNEMFVIEKEPER